MATGGQGDERGTSALAVTLHSRMYRGATVAMFLSGLGVSAAAPQIALFLVRDLGASLTTAGLYYLTSLTAPVAGYLIGSRSDRSGSRMGLFRMCAVLGFLGWTGIALSTEIWMPFVISALVLGFSGAAGSQLFAALHDTLMHDREEHADGVVAIVRMALTAGWVIGPVAGSFLAATVGIRPMLVATGLCLLAQIVPLLGVKVPQHVPRVTTSTGGSKPSLGVRAMLPLLAFTGLYVLVYAGESVKYAFLPIYMSEQLRLSPAVAGAVIGIQPLVELVLMPVSIVLASRVGILRLMVVGAAFGFVANVCFATTGTAAGMFAGQILMGGVWGIFAALGIIVAQRLLPQAVATASAVFMSSTAISSALGGLSGGLGAAWIGLPGVFWIPAICALLASLGLARMSRGEPTARSVRPTDAATTSPDLVGTH